MVLIDRGVAIAKRVIGIAWTRTVLSYVVVSEGGQEGRMRFFGKVFKLFTVHGFRDSIDVGVGCVFTRIRFRAYVVLAMVIAWRGAFFIDVIV